MKKVILIFTIIFLSFSAINLGHAEDFTASSPDDFEASAPDTTSSKLPTLSNPLRVDSLTELLLETVNLLVFIGVILAVFMFVFIGFKFVWAQGKPEEITKARNWFLYAVIGTAILISSKVLVEGIKHTLTAAGLVEKSIWDSPND